MFKIKITPRNVPKKWGYFAPNDRIGFIQIGNFKEEFCIAMEPWSPGTYEKQWREGLERILDGEAKSAIVTSFTLPSDPPCPSDHYVWWPLYSNGEIVYVHNQLKFYEHLDADFDESKLYEYIDERTTVTEDGDQISEWHMPKEWIRKFLDSDS
jgi:hypothetical protein